MANASIDENNKATITGVLNSDGKTVTRIKADPATHGLSVENSAGGSDNGGTFAATDDNGRPTLFAVSSVDGITLVALYVNSSGQLLVNSN